MVLVPANMPRLSFGPCKKKICFWSLQNILFFKQVPAKSFVSENSPCNFFFYRDQNLNEAYL